MMLGVLKQDRGLLGGTRTRVESNELKKKIKLHIYCNPPQHIAHSTYHINDSPSLHWRSYEVIRPKSASSPVISNKQGQGIVSKAIAHFLDQVHNWWSPI